MLIKSFTGKLREEDKILHIKYSAAILFVLSLYFALLPALILTFLIGLAKECWDHYYGSGFCLYDMLANLLGMVMVIPFVLLSKLLFSFSI